MYISSSVEDSIGMLISEFPAVFGVQGGSQENLLPIDFSFKCAVLFSPRNAEQAQSQHLHKYLPL